MKVLSLLLIFGMVALLASSTFATVTINEIRTDQSGGDDDEYFELAGIPGESLDGLTYLVIGDGTGGSGTLEAVIDLTGYSIPLDDGIFLGTETTFGAVGTPFEGITGDYSEPSNAINFENSDNVTHLLVSGFTGANGDDLDTNDDGTLDSTPWTSVLDAIGLVESAPPEHFYGAALGFTDIGPDGSFVPGHVYRSPDGTGSWNIGDFGLALGFGPADSPGTSNVPEPASIALLAMGGLAVLRRRR